ncbi:prolyl oligopeptidase family serine peptidase [Pontiella sulfatireligans]|uniref:BD-FAE-like domain-containing protein n=1 Tax=Pontiella sulfatireligans TaxID=2750658 RepID=A0A6C2UVP7_9BACT|nr:prolyl oligopeptidase family serine peptidase [Pontiella sulfatireligans]VGO23264.1 hypothetical protein SCARR_05371 [Pontiella sulfatireligans]
MNKQGIIKSISTLFPTEWHGALKFGVTHILISIAMSSFCGVTASAISEPTPTPTPTFKSVIKGAMPVEIFVSDTAQKETPLVFYLKGLPHHSGEYNKEIITLLTEGGCHVAVVDYQEDQHAEVPTINKDVLALRHFVNTLQKTYAFNIDRVFVIPEGYTIAFNIEYYKNETGSHAMDIWYPYKSKVAVPLVMQSSHSKDIRMSNEQSTKYDDALIEGFAIHGYAAAKIDHPAQENDVMPSAKIKSAVRVLRHNAHQYHIDKDKIGAFGFSKGSSSVSFLAFDHQKATDKGGYYYEENESIQVALLFASRFDLVQAVRDPLTREKYKDSLIENFGNYTQNPALYLRFSSISYVTPQAPPIFLSTGAADADRVEQARALSRKLKENSVPFIYTQEPFDEHQTTSNPHTLKAIYNFFDEYLK